MSVRMGSGKDLLATGKQCPRVQIGVGLQDKCNATTKHEWSHVQSV